MRIKEFALRRYGPLPDTERVMLGDFSLLFGNNEDGKTLTIDGLVKLLFRKNRKLFERIDRVDEDPEGYVIVEVEKDKEVKLPDKGDLTDITNLTPQECRNIFIIRNSDLSIALESEFYRNVTDRLTGLRTDEIRSIKSQLQQLGKLTKADTAATLRDLAGEKLKTRIGNARGLASQVEALNIRVAEEDLDGLEEELFNTRQRLIEIGLEMEALENARKRQKYEEGHRAYETLTSAHENLKGLEAYNREDERLWSECDRDVKRLTDDMDTLQEKVNAKQSELKLKQEALRESQLASQELGERKRRLDDEIRPEIKNYEMRMGDLKRKETMGGFYSIAAIISAVLLALSVLGIIIGASAFLYPLSVVFLVSTVAFAALRLSFTREKAWVAGMFERIRLAVLKCGLEGRDISEINYSLQRFGEEYSRGQAGLEQRGREASILENEIRTLRETDIAGKEEKRLAAREKIENLANKGGVKSFEEYSQRLKQKLELETSANTQIEILRSHFGLEEEPLEEALTQWIDQITALRDFETKAKDIEYDEKAAAQLKGEQDALLNREQELGHSVADFCDQLRGIEREANEILRLEDDYLHCSTSVDMNAIRDKLLELIAKVECEKDDALEAIGIFEELQGEEEEKISALFGGDSAVSKHFREITGGLYEEVHFVLNDVNRVEVKLKDGSMLAADKLSGGAYDQLYLSIRLALGEELLKGHKGFFIMDDPFIKADKQRLQRQIDILKSVSQLGWQIVYFTAKDEVRDALKQDMESGTVRLVALQGVFSQ